MSCGFAEPSVRKSPAETVFPFSTLRRALCSTSYARSSTSFMAIVSLPFEVIFSVPETGDGMSVLPFVRRSGFAMGWPAVTSSPSATASTYPAGTLIGTV